MALPRKIELSPIGILEFLRQVAEIVAVAGHADDEVAVLLRCGLGLAERVGADHGAAIRGAKSGASATKCRWLRVWIVCALALRAQASRSKS